MGPRAGRALDRPAHGRARRTSWPPPRTAGDDAKLLDELGDVLFQVHFLSLLLEERGAGSLAEVAEHVHAEARAPAPAHLRRGRGRRRGRGAAQLGRDQATEAGREPGIFGEVPENLPGPLYARKVQRRAASSGLRLRPRALRGACEGELEELRGGRRRARSASTRSATCCSPRSTSRASSRSTRSSRCARPPTASAAAWRPPRRSPQRDGADWDDLDPDAQLRYYARARLAEP